MLKFLADHLIRIGFTEEHLSLILLCGFSASVGSFVRILLGYWGKSTTLPEDKPSLFHWTVGINRVMWIGSRLLVGFIIGLFLGLYLTGALTEGVDVIARIIVVAAFLGYLAPEQAIRRAAANLLESMPAS